MILKITTEHLKDWGACYYEHENTQMIALIEQAFPTTPLKFCDMDQFSIDDRFWLLLRKEIIPEKKLHELACRFAERVLHIYEEQYPNDDSLRNAIAAKRKWLRGEISDEELRDAFTDASNAAKDAWDAWNAASAARSASTAVKVAAWDAASAVVNAANSGTTWDGSAAARGAADAASAARGAADAASAVRGAADAASAVRGVWNEEQQKQLDMVRDVLK